MASKSGSVKVAFDFDPEIKFKLATLKAELRLRGLGATETAILEALVENATVESVGRLLRRYLRD